MVGGSLCGWMPASLCACSVTSISVTLGVGAVWVGRGVLMNMCLFASVYSDFVSVEERVVWCGWVIDGLGIYMYLFGVYTVCIVLFLVFFPVFVRVNINKYIMESNHTHKTKNNTSHQYLHEPEQISSI